MIHLVAEVRVAVRDDQEERRAARLEAFADFLDEAAVDAGVDQGANAGTGGSGSTTFVYTGYADSNLVSGYDTISGFRTGIDKIDVSALGLSVTVAAQQWLGIP